MTRPLPRNAVQAKNMTSTREYARIVLSKLPVLNARFPADEQQRVNAFLFFIQFRFNAEKAR